MGIDFALRPLGRAGGFGFFLEILGVRWKMVKVEIQFATLFHIYKTEGVLQKWGPEHSPGRVV